MEPEAPAQAEPAAQGTTLVAPAAGGSVGNATLRFLRANRRQLIELLLAGLVSNLFVLALPLFSMIIYDRVMGNEVHDTLWALSIGMGLFVLLDLTLRLVRVHFVEHAGARWDVRLDRRLLGSVLAAPADRAIPPGALLARYKQVAASRDVLSASYLLPLADLPFLLLFSLVLGAIAGVVVVVPLACGMLLMASMTLSLRIAASHQASVTVDQSEKLTALVEAATARETLRGRSGTGRFTARFERLSESTATAAARGRFWAGVGQQSMPLAMTASSVIVLIVGVFQVEAQAMSVGALSAASLLGGRIVMFFGSVASVLARVREFRHAMRHLDDLVASEVAPSTSDDLPLTVAPRVVLSGLGFGYGGRSGALSNLDLVVAPGAMVAVVGRAGSGKSTLLKVLSGSLRAASGAYSVGDRVISDECDRLWLAGVAAIKPQDASLTRGSFADTVREWAADATEEAVSRALRESGFGEALDAATVGTNSGVEPAGANLSGGQRQMLAMARVFASGRHLLILDEPTAGLDGTSEQAILAALRSRRGVATIIAATHSPDVIALADRVIVIEGGRIVADVAPGAILGATAARERPPVPVKPVSLTQAA